MGRGEALRRSGVATVRTSPRTGCSYPTTASRAIACASPRARAMLFTGAQGTPWAVSRSIHSPTDRRAKAAPERLLGTGDDEPAVGRLEGLKRNKRLVCGGRHPAGLPAPGRRPRRHVVEKTECGLEEGKVRVAADAFATCPPDAREDGDRGDIAGRKVDQREAAFHRGLVRPAGDAHPADEALHRRVIGTLARARARHPET